MNDLNILIVESKAELGALWCRHLERQGADVHLAQTQDSAASVLRRVRLDVIVLDLVLDHGSALAIADYAAFCQPEARVIFVTDTSFFSDGSIFSHSRNACAFVQAEMPPEDLVALCEHYGAHR